MMHAHYFMQKILPPYFKVLMIDNKFNKTWLAFPALSKSEYFILKYVVAITSNSNIFIFASWKMSDFWFVISETDSVFSAPPRPPYEIL